jgi:hypothetical protein
VVVDSCRLSAEDLTAEGEATFAAGGLDRLVLSRLAFGVNDLGLTLARDAAGGWQAELGGERLDLRPFLGRVPQPGATALDADLRVIAALREAVLSDEATAEAPTLRLDWIGGTVERLDLDARLGQRPVTARVWREAGGRRLALAAPDAQAIFGHLGVRGLRGGNLRVDGRFAADGPGAAIIAEAHIDGFRMVGVPAMAEALTLMSLSGLVDSVTGDGILFDRAKANLRLAGSRLWFEPAYAHGPSLGLRVQGSLDLADNHIDLTGTVSPAYRMTQAFHAIPIIGRLLDRRPGEGAFVFVFSAKGLASSPRIDVNPMAQPSPGIIGELFDFR